jgi:hypothetical protein
MSRVSTSRGAGSGYGDSQSLSSPLNVLHPAYHSGSELLKLFTPGARATQYGCAILQVGCMELLKSCRSECGMPWLFPRQLGSSAR